jgi:pimeloyl-ACP methyl ester carboxylesterase
MAGKILFRFPNRRLSKRLYRLDRADARAVGRRRPVDRAGVRRALEGADPAARVETIAGAGHMLPYEQPDAFARAVTAFLDQPPTASSP